MDVVCVWWSRYGHGGPTLWPEQMAALAELNLECSFDIYFFGDDDDEDAPQTEITRQLSAAADYLMSNDKQSDIIPSSG